MTPLSSLSSVCFLVKDHRLLPLLSLFCFCCFMCTRSVGFGANLEEEQMDLPPGFRFHPTDEELVTHYLLKKVVDGSFVCRAIGDVDLNRYEPWDLPWKAKMGEKEWYFFCIKDRKYPTGLRTNRTTEAGYWKATGKDKEIYRGKVLVGMKKTLVFYRGRAPKGEKTNWVIHEYRVEGKSSYQFLSKSAKHEWVICRVFQKIFVEKRTYGGEMGFYDQQHHHQLPQLVGTNFAGAANPAITDAAQYVPCFSNVMESYFDTNIFSTPNNNQQNLASSIDIISKIAFNAAFFSGTGVESTTEREMATASQETDLTADVTHEISSSVFSNHQTGKDRFDSGGLQSAATVAAEDFFRWNY